MIIRDGDEIRVELPPRARRREAVFLIALGLILAVYMVVSAIPERRLPALVGAGVIIAVMSLVGAFNRRQDHVLILRPGSIGYRTRRGGAFLWVPACDVTRVKVVANLFGSDVVLFGSDGRLVDRPHLTHLVTRELRDAFIEAGYQVEGWVRKY